MATTVLKAEKLVKKFRNLTAVNNISLTVEKGNIYGIAGPNGSGKSTTLGMLSGVLQPLSGTYSWFGQPPGAEVRRRLGILLEQPNFHTGFSAQRNLEICATIKGVPFSDIERVLKLVNLWERRESKFRNFSTGMKQRLGIANTLLGAPEVLILDEPTNGLDPQGIKEVRELIKQLAGEGMTIMLASHLLDELQKVCTHLAVIKGGVLRYEGTVAAFTGAQVEIQLAASDLTALKSLLHNFPGLENLRLEGDKLIALATPETKAADLNRFCFDNGIALQHLSVHRQSLEEQFFNITNKA